jgi:uncharacterized protein
MFLFYGIGGGLFMRVSLTTAVVIALGFFAVEAAASRLWLVRFRYGPVEWVWRQVTYWKRVPLPWCEAILSTASNAGAATESMT